MAVIPSFLDDGDDGDAENGDDDDDGVDGVWTAANNPALFGLSVSVLWMCAGISDTHTHAHTHAGTHTRRNAHKHSN